MRQARGLSPRGSNRITRRRRLGQPSEVAAAAVLFLESNEASCVTGHTLAVAGGR